MEKRLFDHNPVFGITQYAYLDDENDLLHIEAVQDVESVVEGNKARFNDTDERARWADGAQHVAQIPLVVLQDLYQRGIWRPGININSDEGKAFRAWLNDPENRFFRTRPGRV